MSIVTCKNCGGLFATAANEHYAGTPCTCGKRQGATDDVFSWKERAEAAELQVGELRKWVQMYSECDCDTRRKLGQPHWFACRRALADKMLWPDDNVQREVEPLVDQLEQSKRLNQAQQIVIDGLKGDVEKLEARWKQQMQKEAHANQIFLEYEAVVREILANERIHDEKLLARARAIVGPTEKRIDEAPPMPSLDGPEPTLSLEDQAALDAIKCKRCGLHGLRCVFCTPASSSTCGH